MTARIHRSATFGTQPGGVRFTDARRPYASARPNRQWDSAPILPQRDQDADPTGVGFFYALFRSLCLGLGGLLAVVVVLMAVIGWLA